MDFSRRNLVKGACIAAAAPALATLARRTAAAQGTTVKIGVLNDMSGPSGAGSMACVQQAVQDFGNRDIRVEIVSGDHQNKSDVAASRAQQWFDVDRVDVIVDVPQTGPALAVSRIARERNKILLASGSGGQPAPENASTIYWTHNFALAASTVGGLARQGGDKWFFVTPDATFGHNLERDVTAFVQRAGGKVVGSVRVAPNQSPDLESPLRQAQSNQANVIALATVGEGMTGAIRQTTGLDRQRVKVAALNMLISDVQPLGLGNAQKIILSEAFYWDVNDRTRAFASRLRSNASTPRDWRPGTAQAACYSAVLHYLKAVAALRQAADGRAIVARMKQMPTDDDAFGPGQVQADGVKVHPAHLFEVKTPNQSSGAWDYYNLLHTTSAQEAFAFDPRSACPVCGTGTCRCKEGCACTAGCCPQ